MKNWKSFIITCAYTFKDNDVFIQKILQIEFLLLLLFSESMLVKFRFPIPFTLSENFPENALNPK